jgi:hypothetical protein
MPPESFPRYRIEFKVTIFGIESNVIILFCCNLLAPAYFLGIIIGTKNLYMPPLWTNQNGQKETALAV